jgi:hypothetical protein
MHFQCHVYGCWFLEELSVFANEYNLFAIALVLSAEILGNILPQLLHLLLGLKLGVLNGNIIIRHLFLTLFAE